MAYTQQDLNNLDAAITGNELSVEFEGRKVTYRSMDDLLKARAHVASVMATAPGTGRSGPQRFTFTTSRGD